MNDTLKNPSVCRIGGDHMPDPRKLLPKAIEEIIASLDDDTCFAHIGDEPIHFSISVRDMIEKFREVLFPGYFSRGKSGLRQPDLPHGTVGIPALRHLI